MAKDKLLTTTENEVLDRLVSAWNAFLDLEQLHPEEQNEFRHAMNMLQVCVMARPVQREFNIDRDLKPNKEV